MSDLYEIDDGVFRLFIRKTVGRNFFFDPVSIFEELTDLKGEKPRANNRYREGVAGKPVGAHRPLTITLSGLGQAQEKEKGMRLEIGRRDASCLITSETGAIP
jgi:hypothetical protein